MESPRSVIHGLSFSYSEVDCAPCAIDSHIYDCSNRSPRYRPSCQPPTTPNSKNSSKNSSFDASYGNASVNTPRRRPCKNRRVRFETTPSGEIVEHEIMNSLQLLTEDEMVAAWWTRAEQIAIQRQAFALASTFRQCQFRYSTEATKLLTATTRSDACCYSLRTHPFAAELAYSCARGLEPSILPLLSRRRRHANQRLLTLQHRLCQLGTKRNTEDLLALSYQRSTKYASLWARVMADGDALATAVDSEWM